MSNTLARRPSALPDVPTRQELEALGPGDRWTLEERLGDAQVILREFNDDELRRWVEVEGKTQTEIARLVGRNQSTVSRRCQALGVVFDKGAGTKGGRPVMQTHNHTEEVIDAEVVEDDPQPRPVGPTYGGEPEFNTRAPRTDVVAVVSGVLLRAGEAADAAGRISRQHLSKRPDEAARWARELSEHLSQLQRLLALLEESSND